MGLNGDLVGGLEHVFFPFSWECHHPNWRTPSFFRGVGQPPTRLCGVIYGTWHIPTCSRLLLTIPLLDVFLHICWWLMGPMMFHPSVDSKVCISSKVSSRCLPDMGISSKIITWIQMIFTMGIHGIESPWDLRPKFGCAFPAARIRKRRPSATASKNARRPRRCRTCWRTTNELLVFSIINIWFIYYDLYIIYSINIYIYIIIYIYI